MHIYTININEREIEIERERERELPRSRYWYLCWNSPSSDGNSCYTQCPLSASAFVMYSVDPTIVLTPMSQRLWKAGTQSTMLKTSRQLALTLDFGKSSTTVDKTVSPQRATLGDPGKKMFNKFVAKKYKKCNQKGCHSKYRTLKQITTSIHSYGFNK